MTAVPRAKNVPSPAIAPQRNLWILNSWRDLLFYVGTPLLLIPVFGLAQTRWSTQGISEFVAAFGAMGHHLPGMIRAYGDRALFERYRWRFILAPIFLAAICVTFYSLDLKGLVLIVLVWGIWHGTMQTYGFCRIYDAKMGSFAAAARRLDFAACAVWFGAGVLLSPARMTDILEAYYASGAPYISPRLLRNTQELILLAAVGVSVLFLVNFARLWLQGKPSSPVKLALMMVSIGFWWYCNHNVSSIIVGIALFEVFHDVQYLSLVWIYNRNRVEMDRSIGGFMRFIFRRSGTLIGLYVGVVFAYGSLAYFNSGLPAGTMRRVLTGVVAASGLLHFYYDGFIWKVREKSTRQSLAIGGGVETVAKGGVIGVIPGWVAHASKWAIAFVLPLAALGMAQGHGTVTEVQRAAWVVEGLPSGSLQHLKYAIALQKASRPTEAIQQYKTALAFDPNDAITHYDLASLLLSQSRFEEAAADFSEALRLRPEDGGYHYGYARALERLNRSDEAGLQYEAAMRSDPDSPSYHYGYAAYLAKTRRFDDAIAQYREVLRLESKSVGAHLGLGNALFARGNVEEAEGQYIEALRLEPNRADVRDNLGHIYLRLGKIPQAIAQYQEALRLDPSLEDAARNLSLARASEAQTK